MGGWGGTTGSRCRPRMGQVDRGCGSDVSIDEVCEANLCYLCGLYIVLVEDGL